MKLQTPGMRERAMDSFHDRISPKQAERIWTAARDISDQQHAFIVHDLDRMRQRIRMLQNAFPENTIHALAIKANPVVPILEAAVAAGMGLEAASIEEVHLAIASGCPAHKIVFDSPAKIHQEIREALSLGIHLNVDNFDELSRVATAKGEVESTSTIGMRVNPEVAAGEISQTSVGSVGSKFGVSIRKDRQRIIDSFGRYPWLTGLHVHVGSQGCGLEILCAAVERIETLRAEILQAGFVVDNVDIGGGLPAAYDGHAVPPAPQDYVAKLTRCVPDLMSGEVQLMTEFGRAIQAGCGIAFSRVEYVRPARDEAGAMAVVHFGADFLLRPVYRAAEWSHEFLLLDCHGNEKTAPLQPVSIAGPLCFAGDFIGRDVPLPRPEVGDWIVIRDCGAYTLSMWSRHCNRGIPEVLGFENEQVRQLRKAESPADIVNYWNDNSTRSTH